MAKTHRERAVAAYARLPPGPLGKKPRLELCYLPLEEDLQTHDDVVWQLEAARVDADPETLRSLTDAVVAARAAVVANRLCFAFVGLGARDYAALRAAHPPTEADHAGVEAEHPGETALWAVEEFPPALVAACALYPKLSKADVEDIFTGSAFTDGERTKLFVSAYKANTTLRRI